MRVLMGPFLNSLDHFSLSTVYNFVVTLIFFMFAISVVHVTLFHGFIHSKKRAQEPSSTRYKRS